jgi:hypothetical protein
MLKAKNDQTPLYFFFSLNESVTVPLLPFHELREGKLSFPTPLKHSTMRPLWDGPHPVHSLKRGRAVQGSVKPYARELSRLPEVHGFAWRLETWEESPSKHPKMGIMK